MARYTKSELIEVQGLIFETPDRPLKESVDNHAVPKRKQKWKRFEFTEEWFESLSGKERQAYIIQEVERILSGYWFYNNGKLTYITGKHYFYLQWFVMDDGNYPQFRSTDARFYYFWSVIETMLWCLGMIYTKYRRQGASARGAAISLYYAITETNILNGTISKTGQDSRDIFQMMIVNGYTNLPSFLKPRASGFDRASKELYLIKQSERIKKGQPITGTPEGLNNRVNWLPTALNSYDSKAVKFLFLDEGAKWKEVSVSDYWPIAQKCLTKGARRYGLAYLPSTINEMEKGGGRQFYSIWKQSDHMSPDFNGQTASRLVKFFLPAYDGFEGYIGEYGESIIDTPTPDQKAYLDSFKGTIYECPDSSIGAKEYLEKQRKRLESDPDALSAEKRQNPFTEKEAFRTAVGSSYFNQEFIHRQKEKIEEGKGPYVRRVDFYRRTDGSGVDWVDNSENGRWELIWDFPNKSEANKYYWSHNRKTPANVDKFGMGGDPFSHTIIIGKGSKGVFYVFRKMNMFDPENSEMFIVRYAGRPKLKSLFFDDAAMTAEYFGCKIGFEEINDEFYEWFLEHGLENYLIYTPDQLLTVGRHGKKKPGIPATGNKAIEIHLGVQVEYVNQHSEKVWFIELLDDWLEFDVSDRTIYDDTMAAGYTLITCMEINNRKSAPPVQQPMLRTFVIKS